MENKPLNRQIQSTFVKILLSTVAATLVTYGLVVAVYLKLQYKAVYPSNYEEQQIPEIEHYIEQHNIALLNPSAQSDLERFLPKGIGYQVVDEQGRVIYGTIEFDPIENQKQLFVRLNTLEHYQGNYVKTVPILDEEQGQIAGAMLLSYQLKLSYSSDISSFWLNLFFSFALISPFLYMVLFTIFFSRRFSRRLKYPLTLLKNASQKIKNKDLDFHIDYQARNELGELCTAFSEMKEELHRSLSAQWELEQDRVEMMEALAHDLKTPLSVVISYAEALLSHSADKDDKLLRYLSVIRENAGKSAQLVRQMQYSSDLDKAEIALHPVPVQIEDFMERKIRDYELQAGQKKVLLGLLMQGESGHPVLVDEKKLERILDNLISNSLQHTPAGGEVNIQVRVERSRVYYRVIDTGRGFSPTDLESAFKRFYRGDPARTLKDAHSGLGLSIAKQLVEKLGGSIRICNTMAGGACVEFDHAISRMQE